jgi:hypothetical protein
MGGPQSHSRLLGKIVSLVPFGNWTRDLSAYSLFPVWIFYVLLTVHLHTSQPGQQTVNWKTQHVPTAVYTHCTPDDGLQICPRHVEVNWRNKLRINIASSWFPLHGRCMSYVDGYKCSEAQTNSAINECQRLWYTRYQTAVLLVMTQSCLVGGYIFFGVKYCFHPHGTHLPDCVILYPKMPGRLQTVTSKWLLCWCLVILCRKFRHGMPSNVRKGRQVRKCPQKVTRMVTSLCCCP